MWVASAYPKEKSKKRKEKQRQKKKAKRKRKRKEERKEKSRGLAYNLPSGTGLHRFIYYDYLRTYTKAKKRLANWIC